MRIIVVGAGDVGSYLAERLAAGGEDVVVIDSDERRVAALQESIDALVITGNGATVPTLEAAGAGEADLLIAATSSDGVNILACHTATELGTTTTIARIEDPLLREGADRLGVDYTIDPSSTAADELADVLKAGGLSEMIHFADGKLVMVGVTVTADAPLTREALHKLRIRNAEWGWVVAALVRNGRTTVAHGDTTIEVGDHVLLMTTTDRLNDASRLIGLKKRKIERVVILGGTRLARLALERMERDGHHVAIVDDDPDRCLLLAGNYPKALVINGDPTDPEVFSDLDLGPRDAVVALTGWDEVNVLSCLVAKAHGAGMVVARFHRVAYVRLLSGVGLDATISSRLSAASAILRFVRRGHIERVATFSDTDAEAIEIEVDEGSPAVGKSVVQLDLPPGVVIGGISRNETTFVPDGSSVIRAGDHIIYFSLPRDIEASAALFSA